MTMTRRTFFGFTVALVATGLGNGVALAKSLYFTSGGRAIRGYDPVAYFKVGKPVKGKRQFSTEWKGTSWSFSSAENLAAFKKSPAKFAPAYGGHCSWAMSRGYIASTVPEAWDIVDGRLYLNFSLGVRKRWRNSIPGHIKRGNANWPRVSKTLV